MPYFVSPTMATAEKAEQVRQLAEQILQEEPGYFVVKVNVRPINNISVYVDGDAGVTIEKCVRLNRSLYKQIVEQEVCKDGEFALEVSSPGIDEPLVFYRQYLKNVGRSIHVQLTDGREMDGILLAADEKGIEMEEEKGKGRKKELIRHFLLFGDIQTTTVNIVF